MKRETNRTFASGVECDSNSFFSLSKGVNHVFDDSFANKLPPNLRAFRAFRTSPAFSSQGFTRWAAHGIGASDAPELLPWQPELWERLHQTAHCFGAWDTMLHAESDCRLSGHSVPVARKYSSDAH